MKQPDQHQVVEIVYTNYRGETSTRRILPTRVWFGSTEWHPEPQWHLDAIDLDKGESRAFALSDVHIWKGAGQLV